MERRSALKSRLQRNVEGVKAKSEAIWKIDADALGLLPRLGLLTIRFIALTVMGFFRHNCSFYAAGLTYFSLLSVIPVLMLMLMLTKPCGLYDWAREKLRVQTDEMIETFFEPKPVPSLPGMIVGKKARPEADAAPDSAERRDAESAVASKQESNEAGKAFGGQARELRDQILKQIDAKVNGFNFGALALAGLGLLAWTVTSMIGQVETSLNAIWGVRKNRPVWKRYCLYAGTLMALPILMALAMSLPVLRVVKASLDATLGATSYTKWAGDAIIALLDSSLFSYAVTLFFASLAVAFVFKMMPNRHVLTCAALEGGFVTTVLLGAWMRLCGMLQLGIAKTSAAYGSFALIPILIVWIYSSWRIVLLGSNMTYAFQCVHSRVRDLSRE